MTDGLWTELRQTLRTLAKSRGFTGIAVLSLAIGIGGNTAMFGVVRALLLTPIAVEEPEELSVLGWARSGNSSVSQIGSTDYLDPESGTSYRSNFSYPLYRALTDAAPSGVDVFAFAFLRGVSVGLGDRPAFLAGGALADGRYFGVLRPRMALGRPLGEADDRPDAPPVAVLSHSFWMRAFGGDAAIVGQSVRVNGTPVEVVGVTADGFDGLSKGGFFPRTEITVPLSAQPRLYQRIAPGEDLFSSETTFWLRLMVRVPRDTSEEGVEQALTTAIRTTPSPLVAGGGHAPAVALIAGDHGAQPVSPETARLLYVLLGVVGIVLLIACVNLASLMLARGMGRHREMAVRRALGSGRLRLLRQAGLEAFLLSMAGTASGVALAVATRPLLGGLFSGSLGSGAFGTIEMEPTLDPTVVGVSVVLGVGAAVLFGVLPALRLSRVDPGAWLGRRTPGGASGRLGAIRALIVLQIGVSLPLVVGAALFLRTIENLGAVELGFDPEGVASFQVDPGYTTLAPPQYPQLYLDLLAGIAEIPGVRSVTLVENALMSGIVSNGMIERDGARHLLYRNAIGPSFLETMGMRLLAGRMPGVQDDRDAPTVGVVNETAVAEIFGGESPIGSTLPSGGQDVQIVGVVNDAPYRNRRDPVPSTLYPSALQIDGYGGHHVVVRAETALGPLEERIRRVVARIDPDLPVPEIRAQRALIAQTHAKERAFTQVLSLFGLFALLLACIGLHGITGYSVSRRTSEIGVRLAVGARPGQVLWLVLRQVIVLSAAGIVVGTPMALATGPLAESLLFGVAPNDWRILAIAALALIAIAATAGIVPAARAARTNATVALSSE